MQHSSQLYGLQLRSCWPLPTATTFAPALGDVEIRLSPVQALRERARAASVTAEATRWFRFARDVDDAVYLSWSGVLLAAVAADRRRIEVASATAAGPASLNSYLFAQILSFPLLRLGLDPLHAAVVTGPAGTIALLGDSGVGKSTMTAALLRAGSRIVSDDLLALLIDDLTVLPGPARLRLLPSTARRVLPEDLSSRPMNSYTQKRAYELPDGWHATSRTPLRALYVLQTGDRSGPALEINSVTPAVALRLLLHHTFNPLETTPSRLRRQLDTYGRIANSLPVRCIRVRRQFRQLADAAHRLIDDVAALPAPGT